jgi:hypothetical protein
MNLLKSENQSNLMEVDGSYKRILHKLDYYNYQQGFIFRHLNQGTGWHEHISRCHRFILKAIEHYKPESVTILGSGWLLEIPLENILSKVKKIYLVDIIHPPGILQKAGKIPGIEFITDDISGGLIRVIWEKTSKLTFFRKLDTIKDIFIPEYKPGFDPGMIISLNILSQLDVLPLKYLKRKSRADDLELTNFRREIQTSHINFLKKYRSVLISDLTEIFMDRSGNKTENETVITEMPSGIYREDWIWNFDLKESDYHRKKSVLKVAAIII